MADRDLWLEADSEVASSVYECFIAWAGDEEDIRVFFTPDTLMAIDTNDRQGYLYDEVYFVSIWAGRGAEHLSALLNQGLAAGRLRTSLASTDREHAQLHEVAITKGHPIADVRHLL